MIDPLLIWGVIIVTLWALHNKYAKNVKLFKKGTDMVIEPENEVVIIDKSGSAWIMEEAVHKEGDMLTTLTVADIDGNKVSGLKVDFLKGISFNSKKEFEENTPLQSAIKINNGLSSTDQFWFNDFVSDMHRSIDLGEKLTEKVHFDQQQYMDYKSIMVGSYVKRFIHREKLNRKVEKKPDEYKEDEDDEREDKQPIEDNPREQPKLYR